MTKYEPSSRCLRCMQPWNGWGVICNECRQIEATKNLSNNNSFSGNNSNYNPINSVFWDLVLKPSESFLDLISKIFCIYVCICAFWWCVKFMLMTMAGFLWISMGLPTFWIGFN